MLGFGLLLLGLLHYLLVRGNLPLYGFDLSTLSLFQEMFPAWLIDSFPSFAFVAGLTLLEASFREAKSYRLFAWLPLKWIGLAIFCEILQRYISTWGLAGVFDINDIFASIIGGFSSFLFLISGGLSSSSKPRMLRVVSKRTLNLGIYGLGFILITATSKRKEGPLISAAPHPMVCSQGNSIKINAMDIKWSKPRPILENGKIGLYNDTLLISEGTSGIHVVDNSDRKDPKAIGFIEIPGNNDMAVKDGVIYANAYYNLLVIDVTKLPEIKVLKILPDALGKNFNHCSSGFGRPIQRNELELATRTVTQENIPARHPDPIIGFRTTCIFENELDACLVITEDSSGVPLLSGCKSALQATKVNTDTGEQESIYSCSFNIPLSSQLLGYSSACGEDNQGLTNTTVLEHRIDFKSGFCGHKKHYNENIPYFKDQFDAYKTEHVFANDKTSLEALESLFELKELDPETEENQDPSAKKDQDPSTKKEKNLSTQKDHDPSIKEDKK